MFDFIWVVVSIFVIFNLTIFYIGNHQNKIKWTKLRKISVPTSILLTGIFLRFLLIWIFFTYPAPLNKTLEYFPVKNIQTELPLYSKTLTNSKEINYRENQFIVFYKIGCPYCNAAHETIQKEIKNLPKSEIRFVEVNSKAGKILTRLFHIDKAHTILVYKGSIKNGTALRFEEAMVTTSKNGKQAFSADKISIKEAVQYFESNNFKTK